MTHRNNVSIPPVGRYYFRRCKKTPGGVYCYTGGVYEKYFGHFGPPGRYEKTRKNTLTNLSHAGRHKKTRKKQSPLTRTQQQHSSSRRWSCRNPVAPTRHLAPIKPLTIVQTLGEGCAVLMKRRPRGRARRRQRPRLLRRWYSADHSLAFTLRNLN